MSDARQPEQASGKPLVHLADDSPSALPANALPNGGFLDEYRIVRLLGRGAMADIYEAGDTRLRRMVALKVLRPDVALDHEHRCRFEQEARCLLAMNHPNVLTIYDYVEGREFLYSALELLRGETLRQRLDRGTLSHREVVSFGTQIAEGLAAIHEQQIVHGDLKPENLFVTWSGRVKILDFGLSKTLAYLEAPRRTSSSKLTGTLAYMAPEQLRLEPTDHRADIFAFGTILIEMLTNRNPFRRGSPAATIGAILKKEPLGPAHTDQLLGRIARACVQKRPEQRARTAQQVALVLRGESPSARV